MIKQIITGKLKTEKLQGITTLLAFIAIWVFWSFFYKYNLYFQEQLQLFLLTTDYFLKSISTPGGIIGYLGEFMTQFYLLPFAGASIITMLLLALQQLTKKLFSAVYPNKNMMLLSFLPAAWYCMILTNEFYLLSGLIGIVISLVFCLAYISFSKTMVRGIAGLLFIPIIYFLTGGSFLLFLLIAIVFELINRNHKQLHIIWPVLFVLISVAFPLLIKKFYFATPILQTFISSQYYKISIIAPYPVLLIWLYIPGVMYIVEIFNRKEKSISVWLAFSFQLLFVFVILFLGFWAFTNMKSEHTKAFDYYVRNGEWEKVIKLADKGVPHNVFSIYYLNLALAKTGQLGEKMFVYPQVGKDGLFMPFHREHLSAMMGNEVFYQLGLINVSQEYIFESMEANPDLRKTVRAIKRLAETNLINGQYEVTKKYLYKLKQTLFYRKWAKNAETYLYNDEKIDQHPDWGEKRRFSPKQDYFFSIDHIDQILISSLHDHPQNKIAFEYLMADCLIGKDLKNFMEYLPHAKKMGYKILPKSYQEAILYVIGLHSMNPEQDNTFPISDNTKIQLQQYAKIYTTAPNAGQILAKNFGNTYWYYFHFKE